jgi:hypothetical protein
VFLQIIKSDYLPLEFMKKLINKLDQVVANALKGFPTAHPDLVQVQFDPNYAVRADAPIIGKVALLSGGSSGHEPLHSSFAGLGMLDAACPGQLFTKCLQRAERSTAAQGYKNNRQNCLPGVEKRPGQLSQRAWAGQCRPRCHEHLSTRARYVPRYR